MADIQAATNLLKEMIPIMNPDDDFMTIVAAEQKIAASWAKRKKEIEQSEAHLNALKKTLEQAKISSTRPASVPSQEHHITTLNELEKERFQTLKLIGELEAATTAKEAELAALKAETRKLEAYDPAAEHEKELDGNALRLAIYRGMGFEPVVDGDGLVRRMLVRSRSGDVHTVEFASDRTPFETATMLWELSRS